MRQRIFCPAFLDNTSSLRLTKDSDVVQMPDLFFFFRYLNFRYNNCIFITYDLSIIYIINNIALLNYKMIFYNCKTNKIAHYK